MPFVTPKRALALFHGARRVAADCNGEAPRRQRAPLGSRADPARLKRWPAQAQQATMSFFVTSVGKGNGADLGGLAGADAHCQALSHHPVALEQ